MGMSHPDRRYSYMNLAYSRSNDTFVKAVDARRALKAAGHGGWVVRMVAGKWQEMGKKIEPTRAPLKWTLVPQYPRQTDGSVYGTFSGIHGEERRSVSAYVHPDGYVVFDQLPERYSEKQLREEVAPLVPKILAKMKTASSTSHRKVGGKTKLTVVSMGRMA